MYGNTWAALTGLSELFKKEHWEGKVGRWNWGEGNKD